MSTIIGNSSLGAYYYDTMNAIFNNSNTVNTSNIDPQTYYPVILTNNPINPKTASTYVSYTGPNNNIVTYGVFNDLNKDKNVSKTITKYYYYKLLDKWLFKDLLPLVAFVEFVDGKPRLIRNLADYNMAKLVNEPTDSIEKKIDYLADVLISKEMVKHVLKKFMNKHNLRWSVLNDYEPELKQYFLKYIREKLEDAISP
jgi:hypothetical protein